MYLTDVKGICDYMKYYKNLIKNKNYVAIFIAILLIACGIIVFYENFFKFITEGIQRSNFNDSAYVAGISGIIGRSNLGLVLIGIFSIYLGIICIPRWSDGSQDDEDYKIDFQGENIYVKYKKNEFIISKKNYGASDFFFKDKNNKFVSLTRGYQIYNYVIDKERDLKVQKHKKQSNKDKRI